MKGGRLGAARARDLPGKRARAAHDPARNQGVTTRAFCAILAGNVLGRDLSWRVMVGLVGALSVGACTYDYDAFQTPTSGGTTTGGGAGAGGPGGAGAGGTGAVGGAGASGGESCMNRALSFDGDDDVVTISGNIVYDALPAFTVEAWISPSTDGFEDGEWHIVSDHDHDAETGWVLLLNDEALELRIYDNDWQTARGDIQMEPGTWHHVAGTFENETAKVYFDGEEVGSHDTGLTTAAPHTGQTRIGAAAYTDGFYFEGLIEEVRISRVVRYSGAFPVPADPFDDTDVDALSIFHFDEESGEQVVQDARKKVVARLGLTTELERSDPARVEIPCLPELPALGD